MSYNLKSYCYWVTEIQFAESWFILHLNYILDMFYDILQGF